jgi:hypothetical protein
MKYTLQIALAIAFGLSLFWVSQLVISWKLFDVLSDAFREITTPGNLPKTPELPPPTSPIRPKPSATVTPQHKEWRAIAERTKEWNRIYRPSNSCKANNQAWPQMVECANEYIRGRREFDNQLANNGK